MKSNFTNINMCYNKLDTFTKSHYLKPMLSTTLIHSEWTIAEGSVPTGPTRDDHIPFIEDFDDSHPIIDETGDI